MNLAELRTALEDVYGNPLTDEETYYNRVINTAYRKLCGITDWWWLEDTHVLTADAPVAAFTVSVSQGSPTVTVSGTLASAYTARMWLTGPSAGYQVTSVSATTLTMDSSWLGSTSTAQSVYMWRDTFNLPTACSFVKAVIPRRIPNVRPLRQVRPTDLDFFGQDLADYACEFADRYAVQMTPDATLSSAPYQIRIFPPPEETAEYLIKYKVFISDMTTDTDVPIIPADYHPLMIDMAKLELMLNEGEDADRVDAINTQVQNGLRAMISEQTIKGKIHHRFGRRRGVMSPAPIDFTLKNTAGQEW